MCWILNCFALWDLNMANMKPADPFCLNIGEDLIRSAPTIELENGAKCVPQHYLQYDHTLASVEALLEKIDYDRRYPVFASEDAGSIYIQIGIVGPDNYKPTPCGNPKLVFGRRWRVEPNLPTSEIIQTVFLAIKKAREHEIRELFRLVRGSRLSTPLSNHHDLPLMARERDLLKPRLDKTAASTQSPMDVVQQVLDDVVFDGGRFKPVDIEPTRSGLTLVDLVYIPASDNDSAELLRAPLTLTLRSLSRNDIVHGLMDCVLTLSDRHVDETFKFDGYARFSREVDVTAIADLSIALRRAPSTLKRAKTDKHSFAQNFALDRYETDATRIPVLGSGPYADKLRAQLAEYEFANGVEI